MTTTAWTLLAIAGFIIACITMARCYHAGYQDGHEDGVNSVRRRPL